ncbi:MAG: tandem-95 repeat protein [Bacteroidetes Order II. Incertae sedis bacterium]|nr:tandem-95 repeat protein [Bacteroidetes Order II. bacterium]
MQKALKRLTQTIALAFALVLSASVASAQVTVSMADVTGRQGEAVTVPVTITGATVGTPVNSFGFTVTTPAGITFTGATNAGTLSAGQTVSSNATTGVVGGFGSGITTDGALVNLNFTYDNPFTGTGSVSLASTQINGGAVVVTPATPAFTFVASNRLMSVGSQTARVGDSFEVTVSFDDALVAGDNVNAYNFDLSYDPAVMTIDKTKGSGGVITTGTLTDGQTVNLNDVGGLNSGLLRVGGFGSTVTGAGAFVKIAFTAAGAGSSTSTLSNVALQSGNPVYALVAGTTTVVVNSAPVASAGTLTAVEDGSGTTTLVATDANGDALTYTAGNGTNGTVTVAGAVATYTPNADFSGTDSFTFTANDGQTDSAAGTITVTVTAVNDAPVSSAGTLTTNEDTAGTVTLAATDVDGDALTYTASNGTSGTVTVAGAVATYTPNANFNGTDSFTFTANDGTVDSNSSTVTVTVSAVNDAPVAAAATLTTDEDTAGTVTLSATDADGDALTYTATQPANGSVTVAGAVATYTPNANYNGADSFTFTANDGTVDSASATVSVTVTAVNDAPVAVAQSIAVAEDTPGAATLAGSDVDGDALTFSIASQPSNGTVSLVGTTATYTPGANYSGADSFTFVANDGTVDSDPATVTVTVSGVNDAPVATDLTGSGAEDTMISVVLIATDSEGDPVTYALVSDASNGSVVVTGAQAVYTPEANYNGTDSFTYSASDQNATSAPATVTLTVTSVNDAPSVENVSVSTTNDAAAAVQFLGSDVDGDALTFSIAAAPAFGTVTVSGSSASYQANAGFVGTDSFGYVANDGTDDSAMGVVSITVLPALTFSVQFINSGGSGIPSAVDVYYGGSLVATGLSARAGTVYLTLPAGGVTVAVAESPSVSAASAFASYTPGWSQGDQVVAVLSGVGGSPASTRLISFSGSSASSDPALIDARFVHASGASGVLDIGTISTTSDHLPLVGYASGVTFESVTSVQTLPSESAVFRVKNSGISGATLGEYQIDLSSDAGDSMTMILAGQSGGTGLDDLVLFGISADGTPRIPVTVTDIDYESEQPKEFVLDGNFPNPFNPSTNIQFDLPSQAEVKVDVLDLLGRNMISIPAQTFGAGPDQSISIDASSLPSGIYIYRVVAHTSAKTFVSTRTMTLIK